MPKGKRQIKITKMMRKTPAPEPESDDCEELEEEVRQLENVLREKQNELFQLQRVQLKQRRSPPKPKDNAFVKPEEIILKNSIDKLKNSLDLMSMLTGVEVQSYVAGDHCCIVYHMQHSSDKEIKHALRIDMNSDQNTVSKSSLPVGFNFDGIMEDYTNILMPECLGAIRNGLVAYYDRLEQYEALKKLLNLEAELFKVLDTSYIEISFYVKSEAEEADEEIHVTLVLDYRVYDIRPKNLSFKEAELPEGAADALKVQCVVFKKKPLDKAFKEAFISGIGPYTMIKQFRARGREPQTRSRRRLKASNRNYNNDDTFAPDECSDQGDDDNGARD